MVFLRWWFIVCTMLTGSVIALHYGLFSQLWEADKTHISFIALAVFTWCTIFIGRLSKLGKYNEALIKPHLPLCWYAAEALMGLGMLGTLAGFLILLSSALGGAQIGTDPAALQKIISQMATGFATSATATIVGLLCSLLIKLQLINLEYLIEPNAAGD